MPTLHPQIVKAIEAMRAAGLRPIESMTPAEARQQMEETARARKAEPLPVARIQERAMPGPAGPIRLRLYWPNATDSGGPVPAIVYFHGGGHVIGSLDTHDLIARNLCSGAEALVVSVDYRLGPEHKFPAAVEDSWAALEWVLANAAGLGADPERLAVHGDSAGVPGEYREYPGMSYSFFAMVPALYCALRNTHTTDYLMEAQAGRHSYQPRLQSPPPPDQTVPRSGA